MLFWFNLFVFLQLNQSAQKLSVSTTETVCRPAVQTDIPQWEPTYPSVTIMAFIDLYRSVYSSLK